MGRFETQLVYDVFTLSTQEYVRTFPTMEQCVAYVQTRHQRYLDGEDDMTKEEYEIKTVVRLYWVED